MASDAEDDDLASLRMAALKTLKPKAQPIQQVISTSKQGGPWQEYPASSDIIPEFQYQPEPLPEPEPYLNQNVLTRPMTTQAKVIPIQNMQNVPSQSPMWRPSFGNKNFGRANMRPWNRFPSNNRGLFGSRPPHRSFGDRSQPPHGKSGKLFRGAYVQHRGGGRAGFYHHSQSQALQPPRAPGPHPVMNASDASGGNLIVINPKPLNQSSQKLAQLAGGPVKKDIQQTSYKNNTSQSGSSKPTLILPQDKYHSGSDSKALDNQDGMDDLETPTKPRDKFSRYNDSDNSDEEEDEEEEKKDDIDDITDEIDRFLNDCDDDLENDFSDLKDETDQQKRPSNQAANEPEIDETEVPGIDDVGEADILDGTSDLQSPARSDADSVDLDALATGGLIFEDDVQDVKPNNNEVDTLVNNASNPEEYVKTKNVHVDQTRDSKKRSDSDSVAGKTKNSPRPSQQGSASSSSSSSSSSDSSDSSSSSENEDPEKGDPNQTCLNPLSEAADPSKTEVSLELNLSPSRQSHRSSSDRGISPVSAAPLSPLPSSLSPPKHLRSPVYKSSHHGPRLSPNEKHSTEKNTFPTRPLPSRRQSLSPEKASLPRRRSASPKRQISPRKHSPSSPKSRGHYSPGRHLSPRRQTSPRKCSLSPARRPFSPRRSLYSPRRRYSPQRQSLSPRRPQSQRQRHFSPQRLSPWRSRSPQRRSASPPERFSTRRRSMSPRRVPPKPVHSPGRRTNHSRGSPQRHLSPPRTSDSDRFNRSPYNREGRKEVRTERDYSRSQGGRPINRVRESSNLKYRRSRSNSRERYKEPLKLQTVKDGLKKRNETEEKSKVIKNPAKEASLPQIDLDKLSPEERAVIEARKKKFFSGEVTIDPAKKVSLKSIKARPKKQKKLKGFKAENLDESNAQDESEDHLHKKSKKKSKAERSNKLNNTSEPVEKEPGIAGLNQDEESSDSDSGRGWRLGDRNKKRSGQPVAIKTGKSRSALVSLDSVQVPRDEFGSSIGRSRDKSRTRTNFGERSVKDRLGSVAARSQRHSDASEDEDTTDPLPKRPSSSVVRAKPFKADIPAEKIKIQIQVAPKEGRLKAKTKAKPDFSSVYSVPAKRNKMESEEEEEREDVTHASSETEELVQTKIKKGKKKKKKRSREKEVAFEEEEEFGKEEHENKSSPSSKAPRISIMDRLGKKVALPPAQKEKKKKKRKHADDEPASELDVKIQRIKEKNAAIARRQQEIEQDKKRYG